MAGFTPLPQTVLHSSTRLTHLQAHDLLSSFLTEAETNPAYRPDAILTQHGPQASGVGSGTNLTLVHLNRILKGIAGERVGGVEFNYGTGPPSKKRKLESDTGGSTQHTPTTGRPTGGYGMQGGGNQSREDVVEMADGDEQGQAAIVARETDDWQNKEDYELAQVDETADIDGRDPADPGDDDVAALTTTAPDGTSEKGARSVVEQKRSKSDKDMRKQAKLERRKKEKISRNEDQKKMAKAKS